MELTTGTKTAIWMASISLVFLCFMLVFRAAIYPHMYLGEGEPYGISDIIEFLLGCIFLVLLLASGLVSITLLFRGLPQSKKSAVILLLFSIALPFIYSRLHSLAAKWST